MNPDIRLCGESDIDALSEFYRVVIMHLDETVNYPRWKLGEYPARGSVTAAVSIGSMFACCDEGELIGAFVLDDNPHGDYSGGQWKQQLKDGEYMVIHALAVRPDMNGRGIASAMTDFCIETARSRGYKAVRMDVVPDNYPARKLYEKKGFTFAGEYCVDPELKDIPLFALYELNF